MGDYDILSSDLNPNAHHTERVEHDVVQSTKQIFSYQLQLVLPKWLLPSVPGAHALCAVLHYCILLFIYLRQIEFSIWLKL